MPVDREYIQCRRERNLKRYSSDIWNTKTSRGPGLLIPLKSIPITRSNTDTCPVSLRSKSSRIPRSSPVEDSVPVQPYRKKSYRRKSSSGFIVNIVAHWCCGTARASIEASSWVWSRRLLSESSLIARHSQQEDCGQTRQRYEFPALLRLWWTATKCERVEGLRKISTLTLRGEY